MNLNWLGIIVKRFAKGFFTGLVSAVIVYVQQNPTISLVSWKPWLVSGVIAALTGGLLAAEKAVQGYNPQ